MQRLCPAHAPTCSRPLLALQLASLLKLIDGDDDDGGDDDCEHENA